MKIQFQINSLKTHLTPKTQNLSRNKDSDTSPAFPAADWMGKNKNRYLRLPGGFG
jgi:hypothetical protein